MDENNKNVNEEIFAESVDPEAVKARQEENAQKDSFGQEQSGQQDQNDYQGSGLHQGSGDSWTQSNVGRENWNGQNSNTYSNGEWQQQQWNQGNAGGYVPNGQQGYNQQGQGCDPNGYNNPYGYQPYPQQQKPVSSSFGIAALVLGIISLLCFCSCFNLLPAALAVVFGILQLNQEKRAREAGAQFKSAKGLAWGGIICAIVSVVLLVITLAIAICNPTFRKTFEEEYHKQQQEYQFDDEDDSLDEYFENKDL